MIKALFKAKVNRYIELIENKARFIPTEEEALMAMAYANGLRSSCLKQEVGAIIVDNFGNVFSSGYNEVPNNERDCRLEWGECYRDRLAQNLHETCKI